MQVRKPEIFSFNPSDLAILFVRNSTVSLTIDLEIGTVSMEDCSNLRYKFDKIGLTTLFWKAVQLCKESLLASN